MILTIPINPEMRISIAHAEAIKLDISGHPELAELKADLFAAHAHIDALHSALFEMLGMLKLATVQSSSLVKAIDLDNNIANVKALVASWEDSQCL